MKPVILFDLDGTLLDSLSDIAQCGNRALALSGLPAHTQEEYRGYIGNGARKLVERMLSPADLPQHLEQVYQDYMRIYGELCAKGCKPFPGVLEFLKKASEQGFQLAVVSNKFDLAVKGLCRDFFFPYITTAIGESPQVARKPAPDTVFAAMAELGVPAEQCICVGDSDVDLDTAKNAGIPCISVSWGFRSREFLLEHGALQIADGIEELWDML